MKNYVQNGFASEIVRGKETMMRSGIKESFSQTTKDSFYYTDEAELVVMDDEEFENYILTV